MDLPARVIIFSPGMEIKNKPGVLIAISDRGYFELTMELSGKRHTVLAPIAGTGLVFNEPEEEFGEIAEIER
jgi:hypothetical protein